MKSLIEELRDRKPLGFQLISLSGVTVAFFWMIHLIFFTQKDFSTNSYVLTIVGLALLASISTYLLIQYRTKLALRRLEKEKKSEEFERLGFAFINKVNQSIVKGVQS